MAIGKIYNPREEDLNYNTDLYLVSPNVKKAFIGKPKRIRLESGFDLYKFTEFGFIFNNKITEWWSPLYPYEMDPGLSARLDLARHLGSSPADLVRVNAAVRENWNALTYILKARLKKPVYCWWGQCAKQPRKSLCIPPRGGIDIPRERQDMPLVRTDNLPGYAWQFYIPRLTLNHIEMTERTKVSF
jgi:hypothetical protein